jgi:hypothetical protein
MYNRWNSPMPFQVEDQRGWVCKPTVAKQVYNERRRKMARRSTNSDSGYAENLRIVL